MAQRKTPLAATLGIALPAPCASGAPLGRHPLHIALAPWPASCNLTTTTMCRMRAKGSHTFYAE